ncbi:MAG TPA: hypothetical protein VNZ55_04760 [Thermomicrobiales bacterium]|nr:hypothetical protein [Thermomicrobiales bacterium]
MRTDRADPDLAGDAPERVVTWRQRLIAELAGREGGLSDGDRPVPGRPTQPILPSVLAGFAERASTSERNDSR